jgi:hypothetical protein
MKPASIPLRAVLRKGHSITKTPRLVGGSCNHRFPTGEGPCKPQREGMKPASIPLRATLAKGPALSYGTGPWVSCNHGFPAGEGPWELQREGMKPASFSLRAALGKGPSLTYGTGAWVGPCNHRFPSWRMPLGSAAGGDEACFNPAPRCGPEGPVTHQVTKTYVH